MIKASKLKIQGNSRKLAEISAVPVLYQPKLQIEERRRHLTLEGARSLKFYFVLLKTIIPVYFNNYFTLFRWIFSEGANRKEESTGDAILTQLRVSNDIMLSNQQITSIQ